MKQVGSLTITTPGEREIAMTRVFAAPRGLVLDAHTRPEPVQRWLLGRWALRALGRRSPGLNAAAVRVARRLAESPDAAPRWVGKDALKELTSPAVTRRPAARPRTARGRSSR